VYCSASLRHPGHRRAGTRPARNHPLRHRLALPLGGRTGGQTPGFDDTSWRTLDLPHDWSIEQPINRRRMARRMAAFSRMHRLVSESFALPVTAGKKVVVEFDGSI